MKSKPIPPDFAVGFVEVQYINTFLNLILTGKPLLSRDVFIWLDRKGYKTKKSENTLHLLEYASVITESGQQYVVTQDFIEATNETNQEDALKRFILASIPDDDLRIFIKNAYIPYAGTLIWKPESISPFLVQLRDFLMSLDLLQYGSGLLRSTDLFSEHLGIRGLINVSAIQTSTIVSYEELLASLELKEELGELAEKLAYDYEKTRITSFGRSPLLISKQNVAAGYDIDSYEGADSETYDRHIEVKYFNGGHFYISNNEIETARTLKSKYWIYLVTVKSQTDCEVEMVRNPYSNIISSKDWEHKCMLLKVEKKRSL